MQGWIKGADLRSLLSEAAASIDRLDPRTLSLEDGGISPVPGRCRVVLPSAWPELQPGETAAEYLQRVPEEPAPCLILLMRAGYAALGYSCGGTIVAHRAVSRYMVRRSRGKAQLTYKKTKGKSRLGSRIRLQETEKFFRDISQTIEEWDHLYSILEETAAIWVGAPVRLFSAFRQSKTPPPFPAEDPRVCRIPFGFGRPLYSELKRIHFMLHAGRWEL